VLGPILLAVGMALFVPMFLMSMMAIAGLMSWVLTADAEERFAGSELVDLNK
jgi:uncharacterized oligopeptide transporter (OPT) family protein